MTKYRYMKECVRALVVISAALLTMYFLPQSSDFNCGFMGICPAWPDVLNGFVFVFLCLSFGPKRIIFILFIFVFTVLWSVAELFTSGQAQPQNILQWLPVLPYSPVFHGGMAGAVISYLFNKWGQMKLIELFKQKV